MDSAEVTSDELIEPLRIDAAGGPLCPLGRRLRDDPFHVEMCRFFGLARNSLLITREVYPMYELPQLHQAFAACFANWQPAAEGGGPDARAGALWAPQTTGIT